MTNKYCNLVGTNKIKDEYTKINTGFDRVEADINDVNSRITTLDNRVDTGFDQVEADINDVNSRITALDNRVDEIITTPIDNEAAVQEIVNARAGFSTIGARMTQIEEDVETHTQEIVDARAGFSTIGDRMTQIEDDIETNTQELDNVRAGFSTIGDRMTQIEEDLETHKAEKATLNQLGHVNHAVLTATLDTSWSGSSAPYTKTVSVSGILSTDTPIIDVVMSGTYSTDEARIEAWGYIYRAVTADGSITFYATEKPTIDLPIRVKVVR